MHGPNEQELQELYSSIEEAKADIVGLWSLHYLVDKVKEGHLNAGYILFGSNQLCIYVHNCFIFFICQNLLPKQLEECMYVSFLAGCFRSIRLHEAHG